MYMPVHNIVCYLAKKRYNIYFFKYMHITYYISDYIIMLWNMLYLLHCIWYMTRCMSIF